MPESLCYSVHVWYLHINTVKHTHTNIQCSGVLYKNIYIVCMYRCLSNIWRSAYTCALIIKNFYVTVLNFKGLIKFSGNNLKIGRATYLKSKEMLLLFCSIFFLVFTLVTLAWSWSLRQNSPGMDTITSCGNQRTRCLPSGATFSLLF